MKQYVFILGREIEISRAEIERVFFRLQIPYTITKQDGAHLIVETTEIDANTWIHILGGTVKILEAKGTIHDHVSSVSDYLESVQPEGKMVYSINGTSQKIALAIKKELKDRGHSVRYVVPKNSATIIHNNLVEKQGDLLIINNALYVTVAIQPIEAFSKRDYDRPGRDSKSGMLPPKLARIMVNLLAAKQEAHIVDPFCGSGTILTEALLLGYTNLYGSDISEKAIADTEKNISWIVEEEHLPPHVIDTIQLFTADVADLQQHLPHSVDHIVFEPYMGKGRSGKESKQQLNALVQQLTELFDRTFLSCARVLSDNGSIVCIIPRFAYGQEWMTIPINTIFSRHGFIAEPFGKHEHLLYRRPDQFVGREIWLLKKQA